MVAAVDASWTKKALYHECKLRGLTGCSQLNKTDLIQRLNGHVVGGEDARASSGRDVRTVAELRDECRRRGLRNYSALKKAELLRLLQGADDGSSKGPEKALRDRTVRELRAQCKEQGIRGYSKLKKEDLIMRLTEREQRGSGAAARGSKRGRGGPLRPNAQKVFDEGPSHQDEEGHLYVYCEPTSHAKGEWKIGKTTLDPPQRRMKQAAVKNGKTYDLKTSWKVAWCGYVERIVHAELEDMRVVPPKAKVDGSGTEDGGTEWFRGDFGEIQDRIRLILRMVRVREANLGDMEHGIAVGVCCGVFVFWLPASRRGRVRGGSGMSKRGGTTAAVGRQGEACSRWSRPTIRRI